jgi:lipoprotein NlpD
MKQGSQGTAIRSHRRRGSVLLAGVGLVALVSCAGLPDPDLRRLGEGFNTADAASTAAARPTPDARGVISYPTYQVAVARSGDTPRTIAARLGLNAEQLAAYNGIAPDSGLRPNEVLALPTRVPAGGGSTDVTTIAGAALDRAGDVTTTALQSTGAPAAPVQTPSPQPAPASPEPIRHQVVRGETAYSIARLYGVPVNEVADWNGLGPDLAVREGQFLLVPQAGATRPPETLTQPGVGSPTPVPPSASSPLPEEQPEPITSEANPPPEVAPDLGAEQTTPARTSQMIAPVQGPIIRDYVKGRNDGIDIGAPAGTDVRAAAAGTVAAVTTNTDGIQIVVIRHADNLLTVYTHLDQLSVAKDATVSQGQVIGKVRAGDPSFVHFEVRRGMDSNDPNDFLP